MTEDRTKEFQALCARQTPQRTSNAPLKQAKVAPREVRSSVQENKEFNAAASDISKEVYQASKRLQQLTQLVRQNNMFNDPTDQINELAALMKKDITDINHQLDNLQEYTNSKRSEHQSQQAAHHSEAVVSAMKSDVMSTAQGFKDILEVRQSNLKLQQSRKARYGRTQSSALGKPLAFGHQTSGQAALPRPDGVQADDREEVKAPLINTRTQEQLVAEQQDYTQSRADAVNQIESHIVDIGQLFGRLSTLIHEQGDLVRRIDDNVEDTVGNVASGENELIKYFTSLSNNRMLALKVAAILFVFLIFFMFFLA